LKQKPRRIDRQRQERGRGVSCGAVGEEKLALYPKGKEVLDKPLGGTDIVFTPKVKTAMSRMRERTWKSCSAPGSCNGSTSGTGASKHCED
jgi:hypothetical protein